MRQGYFAGLIAGLYRDTQDGRLVTSRRVLPLFHRRWYYVDPAQRTSFENRVVRAHVLATLILMVVVPFVVRLSYTMFVLPVILILIVAPVLQAWPTSGLSVASLATSPLVARNCTDGALLQSRALGMRSLWGFLVLGIMLMIPQGVVAVVDGAWWAWTGVVMFGSCTIYFARLIALLRASDSAQRAT